LYCSLVVEDLLVGTSVRGGGDVLMPNYFLGFGLDLHAIVTPYID